MKHHRSLTSRQTSIKLYVLFLISIRPKQTSCPLTTVRHVTPLTLFLTKHAYQKVFCVGFSHCDKCTVHDKSINITYPQDLK